MTTTSPAAHATALSAFFVAPAALDAGALATAFCVLSPEESRKLAASVSGVEYLLVQKDGTRFASAGWNALQAPPATQASRPASSVQLTAAVRPFRWRCLLCATNSMFSSARSSGRSWPLRTGSSGRVFSAIEFSDITGWTCSATYAQWARQSKSRVFGPYEGAREHG